jgi:hypothetical protein
MEKFPGNWFLKGLATNVKARVGTPIIVRHQTSFVDYVMGQDLYSRISANMFLPSCNIQWIACVLVLTRRGRSTDRSSRGSLSMKSLACSLAALTLLVLTTAQPAQARGFRGGFGRPRAVVVQQRVAVVRQPVIVQQPVAAVVVQKRRLGPVRRVVGAVRGSVRGARLGFRGF